MIFGSAALKAELHGLTMYIQDLEARILDLRAMLEKRLPTDDVIAAAIMLRDRPMKKQRAKK